MVFPPYADDPLYSTASPVPTNLIVAAAVDASGNLTPVSSWGPAHVDLGAYSNSQGFTSYSAGYTSGVAGVIADLLPPDHSAQDVIEGDPPDRHASRPVGRRLVHDRGRDQSRGRRRRWSCRAECPSTRAEAPLGSYSGDAYFSGGSTYSVSQPIDTSGVASPAPQQVYQTERYGNFTYTIPHLVPGTPYIVRLDFAEIYWDAPGQRLFNVLINGNPVLTNFDIFATAGGKDIAISRQFECDADSAGPDRHPVHVDSSTTPRSAASRSCPRPTWPWARRPTPPSIENPSYAGGMAVDGNSATRWSSGQWMQNSAPAGSTSTWARSYNISEVRLNWETAYAVNYQIQTSLRRRQLGRHQDRQRQSECGPRRLHRTLGSAVATSGSTAPRPAQGSDNYSLYDLQVYGTPVTDLAQGRPAYASTVESSYYAPQMAVDGNSSTRWSSGQWMQSTGTGWIYVDLGATFSISEVRLNWETAYAVNYQIQTSATPSTGRPSRPSPATRARESPTSPASPASAVTCGSTARRRARARTTTPSTTFRSSARRFPTWLTVGPPTRQRWKTPATHRGWPSTATAEPAGPAASGCRVRAPAGSTSTWARRYNISEVRLNWETAYAVNYQIQTSTRRPQLDDDQTDHRQPEQGNRRFHRPLRRRSIRPHLLHTDQPELGQLLALRLPGLRYAGRGDLPRARRIADHPDIRGRKPRRPCWLPAAPLRYRRPTRPQSRMATPSRGQVFPVVIARARAGTIGSRETLAPTSHSSFPGPHAHRSVISHRSHLARSGLGPRRIPGWNTPNGDS